jgi:hypothetical protein
MQRRHEALFSADACVDPADFKRLHSRKGQSSNENRMRIRSITG